MAANRIKDSQDLRYGDVLLGMPEERKISIYLGHGIVASFKEDAIRYTPLADDYTAAYRLIPAFGVCDYRPDGQKFLEDVTLLR